MIHNVFYFEVVPPGIEPGTQGFSVLCYTNGAMTPFLFAVAKVVKVFDFANLRVIKNTDKKLFCLLSVFFFRNFLFIFL